jgi:intracellular multiplication protein IcmE
MTNNFENENNEDFAEAEVDPALSSGPEASKSAKQNLAEAWRTKPLFKFMVLVVAVFAVGAGAINFFGSGGNRVDSETTRLSKPPTIKEAPGGTASPYMRQQTELANTERAQQAIASGGSAIPTPLGQPTDMSGFGGNGRKDDPLKELRAETESLKKQVQRQQQFQAQQSQQQRPPEQFDNTLAEAMQRQLQQLLSSWAPQGIKNVTVLKTEEGKTESDKQEKTATAQAASALRSSQSSQKIVVNAGTVSYAQLLTEANSDVPGPILAQIVSGPLSGARAIGSFQAIQGYEKYLVLKFTLADKSGKDYVINAIALDPDTTLGGMATEVDERYFTRVVLPAAAGFLEGLGSALSEGNSSVTTSGTTTIVTQTDKGFKQGMYQGLSGAAQTMGEFFQQQANVTKPLIRVAAGTPFGMFFVAPVREPSTNDPSVLQQYQALGTTTGYPMTGVATGTTGATGYQDPSLSVPYPNYATSGYNGYPSGGYRSYTPSYPSGYGR